MTVPPYEYVAELIEVVDGDTVKLKVLKQWIQEIDFGFYMKETVMTTRSAVLTFRLKGINTPEVHGATKEAGLAAKHAIEMLLQATPLRAVTYKQEKYGRWLVDIYNAKGEFVNDWLVKNGFAVPYMTT